MAALITIIASVVFSLFLIISSHPKKGNALVTILSADGKASINAALKFKNLASLSYPGTQQEDNQNNGNLKTDNLTELLIQEYEKEFLKLNQNGPQTINGKTGIKPISEESFQNLIEKKVSEDISFEYFSEKDIKISEDNSVEAQGNYLNLFGAIIQKNFGNFKTPITDIIDRAIEKQKTDDLEKYLNIASNQINDLLALETPSRWKEFHLQNLNLWQKKLTVYTAILNYKDDPLKGVIALKQVENLIDESENIQTVLENRIKELNS